MTDKQHAWHEGSTQRFDISLYAPNGCWGCLTVTLFRHLVITVGFTREMAGFDIVWRDRQLVTTQRI